MQSRDLNTFWTLRGAVSAVQNLIGADGVNNSGFTLSGIGVSGIDDIFQVITGLTSGTRYEPSLVLKQITTSGVLSFKNAIGAADGNWDIDVSKLQPYWDVIDSE